MDHNAVTFTCDLTFEDEDWGQHGGAPGYTDSCSTSFEVRGELSE